MDVFLLRHGESVNNTLPGDAHIPDPPLTALGHLQAARLAAAMRALAPRVVLSSPLLRAMDTAVPVVAATGSPLVCWAEIAECNRAHPGDGQPLAELRRRFPTAAFEPGLRWPGHPGPETAEQIAARAERLIVRLHRELPPEAPVAVVGHAGFFAFLLRAWLRSPQDGGVKLVSDNACVHHLRTEPGSVRLLRYNDTGHLGGPRDSLTPEPRTPEPRRG